MCKKYLFLYAVTIILTILISASRTIGMEKLSLLLNFIIIAAFTSITLKRANGLMPFYTLLAILAGIVSIELMPRFLIHDDTFYSLYNSFSILYGIIFGFTFFCISGKLQKGVFAVFATIFMGWYITMGLSMWKDIVWYANMM